MFQFSYLEVVYRPASIIRGSLNGKSSNCRILERHKFLRLVIQRSANVELPPTHLHDFSRLEKCLDLLVAKHQILSNVFPNFLTYVIARQFFKFHNSPIVFFDLRINHLILNCLIFQTRMSSISQLRFSVMFFRSLSVKILV